MLTHHLKTTLIDLEDLIGMTESDIQDIKVAQHDPQFERLSLKEEKIKSFEAKKSMIDYEIAAMMQAHPDTQLPELLTTEQHLLLDELKTKLSRLHEVNKEYAKLVVIVSNLYNTFLERLVPTEMQGYEKVPSKDAAILKVRA
jgi:cystathionine beta-lyase family protein involved in aluminum resistance